MQLISRDTAPLHEFNARGWAGPFPFLDVDESQEVLRLAAQAALNCVPPAEMNPTNLTANFCDRKWFKGLHELDPQIRQLAAHPTLVAVVTKLLGPDVLLWAAFLKRLKAGTGHRWHIDVEQTQCHGVTVFIGLRNLDGDTALKVVSGSHNFNVSPQSLGLTSDSDIERHLETLAAPYDIEVVDPGIGGFFVFHGNLWHGSFNRSMRDRDALILQYCSPRHRAMIPLTFDDPIIWSREQPGCSLIAGRDIYSLNRIC